MNPEIEEALPGLEAAGLVPPQAAPTLLRLARGTLLPVRNDVRALLYGGVLLAIAGVGELVRTSLAATVPLLVAGLIVLAAVACLVWAHSRAPRFTWGAGASTHMAFDYVLLLGAGLIAAELLFIEYRFSALGAMWPTHFLVVAVVYALLALRYDSKLLFSLALSSFAAWRGVALNSFGSNMWEWNSGDVVRFNALGCAVLFVALGRFMAAKNRKAHFEPAATYLGWILALGAMFAGAVTFRGAGIDRRTWALALAAAGALLAWRAVRARRFPLFALAVFGAWMGGNMFVSMTILEHAITTFFAWWLVSGLVLIAVLVGSRSLFREDA